MPALAIAPDRLPEQQTPSIRTEITEPDYRAQKQVSSAGTNRRFCWRNNWIQQACGADNEDAAFGYGTGN